MPEIDMPPDFAVRPYDSVWERLAGLGAEYDRTGAQGKYHSWYQWLAAWINITYRFRSCAEHDEAFAESVGRFGDNPRQPEKYHQDRELFGFFVTGLSAIESAYYGLFGVGSILDPTNFPLSTDKNMRNATTTRTVQRFTAAFTNESVTATLRRITTQQEYSDWKDARNTLAHRRSPGRKLYGSVGGPSKTTEWMLQDIPMDAASTASRRRWLADSLRRLLTEADRFTAKHF
jgi:hypothetical protein